MRTQMTKTRLNLLLSSSVFVSLIMPAGLETENASFSFLEKLWFITNFQLPGVWFLHYQIFYSVFMTSTNIGYGPLLFYMIWSESGRPTWKKLEIWALNWACCIWSKLTAGVESSQKLSVIKCASFPLFLFASIIQVLEMQTSKLCRSSTFDNWQYTVLAPVITRISIY